MSEQILQNNTPKEELSLEKNREEAWKKFNAGMDFHSSNDTKFPSRREKRGYTKDTKYVYFDNGYFGVDPKGTGQIDIFLMETGLVYINIRETRKDMIRKKRYDTVLKLAGYEEKQENGVYNLYKNGKKIDQMTREYFDAWNDILFFEVYIHINTVTAEEERRTMYDTGMLEDMGIEKLKCLRFKHIRKFMDRIDAVSDIEWRFAVKPFTPEIILSWITEPRFDLLEDPVTQAELDEYLKKGYISQELHEMCTRALRDKLRIQSEKQSKRDQEHSGAQVSYSALKMETNLKA